MSKYTIGIDFGTLSGRALLVDVATGQEVATSMLDYKHAVMDEKLPCGTPLGIDWALHHPQDYLDVIAHIIPEIISKSGVAAESIIGIGVDTTACSVLPVTKDGAPLCFSPEFAQNPHAYIKLWKHHAAQEQANKLNEIAHSRNEKWISRYGGKISSEWLFPKLWQILEEAPEVYEKMDKFIELGDWIVWQLTGCEKRSASIAGYKAMWHKQDGYPCEDFFAALDVRLKNVVDDKLSRDIYPQGAYAGGLTKEMANKIGLCENTPVAIAGTDAHVCMPALKVTQARKLVIIMGTSSCDMLLSEKECPVPGICGYVEDGILQGFYGYEAGQACLGDHFSWHVENCVPERYFAQAKEAEMRIYSYLEMLAGKQAPGESGLLALDWWNGNRSVLVDVDLTGLILGMTLQTKPEEIYRALVEATAYGFRKIVENFEHFGVPVDEIYAAGGIPNKSAFTMQIYADVVNRPIRISGSSGQAAALASAMFGALAAGKKAGGYDDIAQASAAMGSLKDIVYTPNPQNVAVYDKLYEQYNILHDYFGKGENNVMKKLKELKKNTRSDV